LTEFIGKSSRAGSVSAKPDTGRSTIVSGEI